MGIVNSGDAKHFRGKVGDKVYYTLADGRTAVRSLAMAGTKPFTVNQLTVQQKVAVCADAHRALEGFIRFGYQLLAKDTKSNYYNTFVKHLHNRILTGTYPDVRIDFKQLLVTQGSLPAAENVTVQLHESGLVFNWKPESAGREAHYSDKVMLLAYFPLLDKACYTISGAQRQLGKDMLLLTGIEHGHVAEIYLSFIENNHRNISNSIYLGQLNW